MFTPRTIEESIGSIVIVLKPESEFHGRRFIVLDHSVTESAVAEEFTQTYILHPYEDGMDNTVSFKLKDGQVFETKGQTNTVIPLHLHVWYKPYGHSVIRGEKSVMLERAFSDDTLPEEDRAKSAAFRSQLNYNR